MTSLHSPPPETSSVCSSSKPSVSNTKTIYFHFGDIVRYNASAEEDKSALPFSTAMVIDNSNKNGYYYVLVDTKIHHVNGAHLQWITKRNYRKAKIQFLFSQEHTSFHHKVQFDDVALYSATDQLTARQTAKLLLTLPGITPQSVVTDATACIGGNTIEFARAFNQIQAIEINELRTNMLRHNLKCLNLSSKVTIHQSDYLTIHDKLTQDIVFLDPPWGGKRYKQLEHIRLFMSKRDIGELCLAILNHTDYVVIKVPSNFFVQHFARTVHRKVRVLRLTYKVLLLIVTRK